MLFRRAVFLGVLQGMLDGDSSLEGDAFLEYFFGGKRYFFDAPFFWECFQGMLDGDSSLEGDAFLEYFFGGKRYFFDAPFFGSASENVR